MALIEKLTGRDQGQTDRRREATTKRKEAAAEKKTLQNKKLEQKIREREAKSKTRATNGGTGMKVVFFNKASPRKKHKRKKTSWFRR